MEATRGTPRALGPRPMMKSQSFFLVLAVAAIGCGRPPAQAEGDLGVFWPDLGEPAGDGDLGSNDDGSVAPDLGPSLEVQREHCVFAPGATVAETIGFTDADRAKLPITNVVVIMQENRSFDHYLGRLTQAGHAVDGIPAGYSNPNPAGGVVKPAHATTTCISPDLPHSFAAIHSEWNKGKMDSFYSVANPSGPGE